MAEPSDRGSERKLQVVLSVLLASALMLAGCASETSSDELPRSLGAEVEQSDDVTAGGESPADSQSPGQGPASTATNPGGAPDAEVQQNDDVTADGESPVDSQDSGLGSASAATDPVDGETAYMPDVGERLWPGNTWPGLMRFVLYDEGKGWTAPTEQDDLFVPTGTWVLVSGSGFAPFSAVGLELVSGDWERLEELGESASMDDLSFTDLEPVTADDLGAIEARWQVPDTADAVLYILRAAGPGRWGATLESITDGFLVGEPGDGPPEGAPQDLEWDASRRDLGYSTEDSAAAHGRRRLALGYNHTCLLQQDSTVRCGGYGSGAQAEDPLGEFMAISAGGYSSCGIRVDGTVACWGADSELQDKAPGGTFSSIDVHGHGRHACAVRSDGELVCWGSICDWVAAGEGWSCEDEDIAEIERDGRSPIPEGLYKRVSIGTEIVSEVSCAITEHDEISCWSWDPEYEVDDPPQGAYRSVDVGSLQACAIPIEGDMECWYWGSYPKSDFDDPPAGQYVALSVDDTLCALHRTGGISCWDGDDSYEDLRIFDAPAGTFVDVATYHTRACGLTAGMHVVCWGEYEGQTVDAPGGEFRSLSVGYDHSCGLRHDGTVECWGSNLRWQSDDPTGTFASVDALEYRTCGMRTSGEEVCWGAGGAEKTPDDVPQAGYCRVQGGLVVCGDSHYEGAHSLPEDLPADLATVTAGWGFACGTRAGGETLCWNGRGSYIDSPEGSFEYLRAGTWFACGLRSSGMVECWGQYPTAPSFVQWVQQRPPWPHVGSVAAPTASSLN